MRLGLVVLLLVGVVGEGGVAHAGSAKERKQKKEMEAILKKAQAAFESGQFEEALQIYLEAETIEPRPEITKHIGECQEALGKVDLAVDAYKRYLTEAPNAPDAEVTKKHVGNLAATAHLEVGRKMAANKDYAGAIKEFEAALEAKADARTWYEIANTLELQGESEKAVAAYQRYLAEAPEAPDAGEITARINVLSGKKLAPAPIPMKKVILSEPWSSSKPGLAVGGLGALLAVGGLVSVGVAGASRSAADAARNEADFLVGQDRAILMSGVGTGLLVAAGVALIVSVVIFYLHTRPYEKMVPVDGEKRRGKDFVPTSWLAPSGASPLSVAGQP